MASAIRLDGLLGDTRSGGHTVFCLYDIPLEFIARCKRRDKQIFCYLFLSVLCLSVGRTVHLSDYLHIQAIKS